MSKDTGSEINSAGRSSNAERTHLRTATDADVAAIVEIEAAGFSNDAERFSERKIRSLLRSPRTSVLVAELHRNVTGWIAGFVVTTGPKPWGRIYALAVHPTARGLRLGATLARKMIEILKSRGARVIVLEVREGNAKAESLYRSLGFQPCRQLRDYYGPGLHAIRMVLEP